MSCADESLDNVEDQLLLVEAAADFAELHSSCVSYEAGLGIGGRNRNWLWLDADYRLLTNFCCAAI